MILQFKGKKENWVYEEAETIEIAKFKVSGHKDCDDENGDSKEICETVSRIKQEVLENTIGSEIEFLLGYPIYKASFVKAVTLCKNNKKITYVFDVEREVYLLSGNAKTVRKV